jgi:hypothetical protein
VPGCPADEFRLDGRYMQSMSALVMGNYAAQAVAAGLPDHGWAAMENIYKARYEHDGCPWDATLQWSGEGNLQPQWGRWYMSHPASWYVLLALGGVRLDRLRGSLMLAPAWPAAWGDRLEALPVFLPGLWAEVEASRSAEGWRACFTVKRLLQPLAVAEIGAWLPDQAPEITGRPFDPARARVEVTGLDPAAVELLPSGRVRIAQALHLTREGEGFSVALRH